MQFRRFLDVFKLDSIRNKILLFAVLATLIPSGITAWISYSQNRRALETRINQELVSSSSQTAREMDVWLKERFQELRTLGSSYEVTETVDPARASSASARSRLNEYLRSVRGRLVEYAELMVLDGPGRTIATTAKETRPVQLPADWARVLRTENQLVGTAYWDAASRAGQLILAVPITRLNGQILGALVTRVQLLGVEQQLADLASGTDNRLYIVDNDGMLIVSSTGRSAELMNTKLKPDAAERLKKNEGARAVYVNVNGEQAVGSARHIGRFPWYAVSEVSANTAFREVRRFRNLAMTIIFGLLVAVGIIAYWLGLIVTRPLTRLTRGAGEVAAGDLAVDLPAAGGGEVGYLTHVFNHMVSRLRENRKELDASNATLRKQNEELERLSTTDGLTGLANRRQLSQRLNDALSRSRRSKQAFVVLMADVDNFKSYNDSHGHPAGDEVLKRVAKLIGESIRDVDCAARYGGEEFCVLLTETSADKAIQVAERIRSHVAEEKFPGRHITLSIGIAEFPKNGEAPESVVAAADAALYQAKRNGRDRVVKSK